MQWLNGQRPPKMHKNLDPQATLSNLDKKNPMLNLQEPHLLQTIKKQILLMQDLQPKGSQLLQHHQRHHLNLSHHSCFYDPTLLRKSLLVQFSKICTNRPHRRPLSHLLHHNSSYDQLGIRQGQQSHLQSIFYQIV